MPRWIDMHAENAALIHGDRRTIAQGYWAVIRIYRYGDYSKYWNQYTQQAVGGPKYKYDDFVVQVLARPGTGMGSQNAITGQGTTAILNAGNDDLDSKTFAVQPILKLPRPPQNGDVIYEIDKYMGREQPLPPYKVTGRYEVTHLVNEHGDLGRSEIYYVVGKRIHEVS